MNKKEIKEIKETLSTKEVKFTCGLKRFGDKETTYRTKHKTYGTDNKISSVYEDRPFGSGMNVNKFGPTCVTLFSYNILGKKVVGKIRYEDVKIISHRDH